MGFVPTAVKIILKITPFRRRMLTAINMKAMYLDVRPSSWVERQ
jgi:hypothetical protein